MGCALEIARKTTAVDYLGQPSDAMAAAPGVDSVVAIPTFRDGATTRVAFRAGGKDVEPRD